MLIVKGDLSEAFAPIAPGHYLCKVVGAEEKVGREKGTRYINWKLETQPDKLTVYYSTPIEGRGAGMFQHFLKCAGEPDYKGGDYDVHTRLGQIVSMKLDVESYMNQNGQERKRFIVLNVDHASLEALETLNIKKNEDDIPW